MDSEGTTDLILGGRVTLRQPRHGYRAAIDPLLLAAFVPAKMGERVLEIGCGTGACILALNARVPGLRLTAVEPDATMRDYAAANAEANGAALELYAGAAGGNWPVPDNAYDHVIFNPPFYDTADYAPSPTANRTQAHALQQPLAVWGKAAKRALGGNGRLTAIIHAQQLVELCAALHDWGKVELLPAQPRAGEAAIRVLVRAQLDRRTRPVLRAPLLLHEGDGSYTGAAEAILRDAAAI